MKPVVFLASMFIWAVITAAASLKEPEAFKSLMPFLGAAAAFHFILLGSQIKRWKQ